MRNWLMAKTAAIVIPAAAVILLAAAGDRNLGPNLSK
jgi:hypothetical protein